MISVSKVMSVLPAGNDSDFFLLFGDSCLLVPLYLDFLLGGNTVDGV